MAVVLFGGGICFNFAEIQRYVVWARWTCRHDELGDSFGERFRAWVFGRRCRPHLDGQFICTGQDVIGAECVVWEDDKVELGRAETQKRTECRHRSTGFAVDADPHVVGNAEWQVDGSYDRAAYAAEGGSGLDGVH